jgi:hypothetical protein
MELAVPGAAPAASRATVVPPSRPPGPPAEGTVERLLASGRALVARVLERLAASDYVLQVAGRRVPARSALALGPGEELVLRGERSGAQLVLHLLARAAGQGLPFADALHRLALVERPLGEALDALARESRQLAERGGAGGERAELLLARLRALRWDPASAGAGLAELVAARATSLEARLAALGRRATANDVTGDLQAELARARVELPAGTARDWAARALDALEAEQLADAVRRSAGEDVRVSFVVPDGERSATAHAWIAARERSSADDGEPGGADGRTCRTDGAWRAVLDLDLSALGPLRAQISACGGDVCVRVRAARASAVAALTESLPLVTERLAALGFRARISAVEADPDALARERHADEVRWLGERQLLDVRA